MDIDMSETTHQMITRLRKEKLEILNGSREILDKIELEKRDATRQEAQRIDTAHFKARCIEEKIDCLLTTGKVYPPGHPTEWCYDLPTVDDRSGGSVIGTTPEGREVRAYAPTEKLSASVRALPDGIQPHELDLGRYVRALVSGDWRKAQAEYRAAQHEKRAMSVGNPASAGWLVPEAISANIIDYARNQTRVIQAGAQTVTMESGDLHIGTIDGVHTPYWVGENASFTESALSIGVLSLKARKQGVLVKISLEAFEDCTNLSALISNAIAADMAVSLDYAALYGSGAAHEPLGLKNVSGIQSVDCSNSAIADYAKFAEAWQKIQEQNGPAEGQALLLHPELAGDIDQLQESTERQPLRPPASWDMIKKLVTTQVSNAAGTGSANKEAFQGVFSQMLIGVRTSLDLEVSRVAGDSTGSALTNGQVWLRSYWRGDIAVTRPAWFVHIQDIQ